MYPVIVWLREVWVVYLCDNHEHGCWWKEGSGVGDEHVMSKVWLISSSRLFLLLLLLHKAVVWSLQIKASINKIAKLVFYKNKFLTCRSLLNIWFQGSFLLSSCSYMQLLFFFHWQLSLFALKKLSLEVLADGFSSKSFSCLQSLC